jgi:heme a synthase
MMRGVATRANSARGMPDNHAAVRVWLVVVAILVIGMILVGGATRLTDSGLSITEWQPLLGVIPPLSDADWQAAFDKYRQIPQYQEINKGMSLAAFQYIYWWEWAHRFMGRIIGLVFAIPLLVFWLLGMVPAGYKGRLLFLLVLGGIQGVIGWYMVKSGLVDRVDVSQYRLALHLSVAFVILGILTWYILELGRGDDTAYLHNLPAGAKGLAVLLAFLVLAQVALGAFVAGTKAGLTYNTWPLIDGQFIPHAIYDTIPWYVSLGEDHRTIQFNHRMVAYLMIVLALAQAVRVSSVDDARVSISAWMLTGMIFVQAGLGIWTLLAAEGRIPIGLGLAHQTFAAFVFMVAVWHLFSVKRAATS